MSRMAPRSHMQVVFHNYKEVIIIHCIVITHFREVINSKDVLLFLGWFSLVGSFIFRSGKACFAPWCKSVSMSVFVTWIHPHDFGTAPERNLLSWVFIYLWLAWYFPNKRPSDSKDSSRKHVVFFLVPRISGFWVACSWRDLWFPSTLTRHTKMAQMALEHWRTGWRHWSMEIHTLSYW